MDSYGFDQNRVKEFVENTIEDYKHSLIVNEYMKNIPLREELTDDTFIQVALRVLVERRMFLPQKGSIHIAPRILGLGHEISVGEGRYFFKKIVEDEEILRNSKDLRKCDLVPDRLLELCGDVTDGKVLIPTQLYFRELMRNDTWQPFYDKIEAKLFLTPSLPIHRIPYKSLSNKIVILGTNAAEWKFAEFNSDITCTTERLDIKFGELRAGGKIDITVRTLNKFEIKNKNHIKMINLID